MFLHFLWAAFMVLGLPFGLIVRSRVLRWVHFLGMSVTAMIAMVNAYCPLTILEETLRFSGNPAREHTGNFLAHHLSNLLYPDVKPWFIRAATIAWGLVTLIAMVLIPPGGKKKNREYRQGNGEEK